MSPDGRSNLLRLAAAVAAVVAATGAVTVIRRDDGPSHPDAWDERVTELVEFVEEERGHRFEYPVAIDFLTPEEYADQTRSDAAELTDEERDSIELAEGLFRAVGLVEGDIDLFESSNDLADTGTLAFYSPETERITVRGTEVTPELATTLVHELTHALQDQVFGIRDRLADEDATSGELLAFRALIEGDAVRIERRWEEEAGGDPGAADATDAAAAAQEAAFEAEDVPEALLALFAVPYALGEGLVTLLDADRGVGVDDAFADPPTTEEHLLDPLTYLDDEGPADVEVPAVEDVEVVDEGDFGAASLYLVLAARIDARQALAAATGWGGDAYVNYERDGRACLDLAVVGDDEEETGELATALEAWVAAGPAGTASVEVVDGQVRLQACDPGAEVAARPNAVMDALSMAAVRTFVLASTIDAGAPDAFARCYADGVVEAFTAEELIGDAQPADFESRLGSVAEGCR